MKWNTRIPNESFSNLYDIVPTIVCYLRRAMQSLEESQSMRKSGDNAMKRSFNIFFIDIYLHLKYFLRFALGFSRFLRVVLGLRFYGFHLLDFHESLTFGSHGL